MEVVKEKIYTPGPIVEKPYIAGKVDPEEEQI
jgi:hypothetical protein